ncbi:MAG: hypothetical protein GY827_03710 [Cytophagales bacterium]|nr:hypothetical protein [Cytophagales bacterium]
MKKSNFTLLMAFFIITQLFAQRIPDANSNIDYLCTFGKAAGKNWGDDDHVQTFFFVIPKTQTTPVYLRVYDPDLGGEIDQINGEFNSKTKFAIYGGKEAFTNKDVHDVNPKGNYKSGVLLASKVFGISPKHDKKWYTFGPFNPLEGELVESMGGYIFKVIAQGVTGDDGNLYRYFLSTEADNNKEVEGANAFTYEYCFRLKEQKNAVTHLYPFIQKDVISITQHNFDFDFQAGDRGGITIYSVAKNRQRGSISQNDGWATSKHLMTPAERNTTIDIQITPGKEANNDMVLYILNQYNKPVAFYTIPIGGPPKYKYNATLSLEDE